MTQQVEWDRSLFIHPSSQHGQIDLVETGSLGALAVSVDPRISSLETVASLAETLLKEPLSKVAPEDKTSLSERANLFLHLQGLNHEVGSYNKKIENTLWITVLHVILLILSLGFFSLEKTMKIELLPTTSKGIPFFPVEKLLGIANREEAQSLLRSRVTIQDLYTFPQEERWQIAGDLDCQSSYEAQREALDNIHSKGFFGHPHDHLFAQPLSALDGKELGPHLLYLMENPDSPPVKASNLLQWPIEQIAPIFGGPLGKTVWEHIFQSAESKAEFAKCPSEKVAQLIECKELQFVTTQDSSFLPLLSKDHWESFNQETLICLATLLKEGSFEHLNISKQDFLEALKKRGNSSEASEDSSSCSSPSPASLEDFQLDAINHSSNLPYYAFLGTNSSGYVSPPNMGSKSITMTKDLSAKELFNHLTTLTPSTSPSNSQPSSPSLSPPFFKELDKAGWEKLPSSSLATFLKLPKEEGFSIKISSEEFFALPAAETLIQEIAASATELDLACYEQGYFPEICRDGRVLERKLFLVGERMFSPIKEHGGLK